MAGRGAREGLWPEYVSLQKFFVNRMSLFDHDIITYMRVHHSASELYSAARGLGLYRVMFIYSDRARLQSFSATSGGRARGAREGLWLEQEK